MATDVVPAASAVLTPSDGKLLGSEATAFAAGDSLTVQNTGDVMVHIHVTTAGTGIVVALDSSNNVGLTLAVGDLILPPLDPAVFGTSVTITTATAIGSAAAFLVPEKFVNPDHNPFETDVTALDH